MRTEPKKLRQKRKKHKRNHRPSWGGFLIMINREISPLQLAEEIPPEGLRKFYGGRRKKSAYKDLSCSAQYHLEAALSLVESEFDESQRHFDAARNLLEVMSSKNLPYGDKSFAALYSEAVILRAQLPVFDDRRLNFPEISIDTMRVSHGGLVRILGGRVNRRRDGCLKIPLPDSRRAELELAGLLSRMGEAALFPYFAVGREERSNDQSKCNHDFYTITPEGKKVAIQVKTTVSERTKEYDSHVLLLGRNEMGGVVQGADLAHGGISTLLRQEDGGNLSYRERYRLNSMSRYVIDRIQEHAETNLQ